MSQPRSGGADVPRRPTVSVVVPVLNEARLPHALDSVLAQTYRPAPELIVVDGGSTDRATLDAIAEYRDHISVLVQGPDRGIFDGINKGNDRASGDVIGFLGADDRYGDPGALAAAMVHFDDEAVDACYGDVVYVDGDGNVVRYWKTKSHSPLKMYCGWHPPHPATFIRRRVFDRYGGFNIEYRISADYEFFLRIMLKHRIKAKYIRRTIAKVAPGGTSAAFVKGNIEVVRMPWRLGVYGAFLVPFLKPARKVPQRWRLAAR